MDYPRQVSLRLSDAQLVHCKRHGGVTRHIRRLLDVDMGAGTTELEKLVAQYIKKYAPDKGV